MRFIKEKKKHRKWHILTEEKLEEIGERLENILKKCQVFGADWNKQMFCW